MASEEFGGSNEELNSKRRQVENECDIVYTRRTSKKGKKASINKTSTASVSENPTSGNPSGREAQVPSTVLATAATDENVNGPATASPVAASPTPTLPVPVAAGTDVRRDSHVVTEPHEPRREESIPQEDAHRVNGEEVQPELPSSTNDGSDKDNVRNEDADGSDKEKGTGQRPNLQDSSENNLPEQPGVSVPQIPTENDEERGNSPVDEPLAISCSGDYVKFKLGKRTSKGEIKDLSQKLEDELENIRSLFKEIEAKELHLSSFNAHQNNYKVSTNGGFINAEIPSTVESVRATNPGVVVPSSMMHQEGRPIGLARAKSDIGVPRNPAISRPYNRQLSISLFDTGNRPRDFVEKEKRMPKANQFYRNSEFLLGKDRLPTEGNNKRLKTSNLRKRSGDERAFRVDSQFDKFRNQVFRNCSTLLQRLMKHKFSWVFNTPVDVMGMGLLDYYDIIKHPMDLGTIKTKLSEGVYNSPREFADDVRLVFNNALTYNPKGQDVHTMAEELLQIFEERWGVIELEYNEFRKFQLLRDGPLSTPTSRRPPNQSYYNPSSFPAPGALPPAGYVPPPVSLYPPQQFDRREAAAAGERQTRSHHGRTPAPKKPKAKDPDKRDMTPEEKQRLSKHLQDLPSEKLDAIVQIVKKRNTALSQHDDEIEVDIDSVDPETLWELDRFVSNYKKSLSKSKRRAELARARNNLDPNAAAAVRFHSF
ncbi:hypothetical protein M569_06920 [Genlisea aurea]|uniref:Transcription factor GTE4-like n=1 Tax=Genlisea aurea TaxID=192259 RepID=S8CL60_9LAMI|nr:hypothetical protein M569_06920 [Genlisea aurea]